MSWCYLIITIDCVARNQNREEERSGVYRGERDRRCDSRERRQQQQQPLRGHYDYGASDNRGRSRSRSRSPVPRQHDYYQSPKIDRYPHRSYYPEQTTSSSSYYHRPPIATTDMSVKLTEVSNDCLYAEFLAVHDEILARNLVIPNPSSTITTTYQQRTSSSSSSSSLITPQSKSRAKVIQETGMYHYQ